ncbi:hypothetical protein CEV33_4202 [Brucella grignonensis]|uniref:Uncharacterized protein n=1 Tax=Brucella grignonensis TaxID=94627 RepID=A0A256FQU3_9HYPH|nr:hypothetical protein CEV33_4202 [Brucella grignonensis]
MICFGNKLPFHAFFLYPADMLNWRKKGGKHEQYYFLDGACYSAYSGGDSFRLSSPYASR